MKEFGKDKLDITRNKLKSNGKEVQTEIGSEMADIVNKNELENK